MTSNRIFNAIDTHTAGEPTRIITKGVPTIIGKTMMEKKEYMEEHLDWLRRAVMLEPRGHANMFGAILTEPVHQDADIGIIFMDAGGYLNMCGHGTIGTSMAAVETGIVPKVEPITKVRLDAPAGLVEASVAVVDGKVKSVTVTNVPSFLYQQDVKVTTPMLGEVTFDIAFGGSFFALIKSDYLGYDILPEHSEELMNQALELREIINREIKVSHPLQPHIKTVDLIEIYGPAVSAQADARNVVIFGDRQIDRSPCGTGTSAKMATLCAKGKLAIGEEFVYESITGTMFQGKIISKTKVGEFDAYIPQITGSAWITGFNQFVIDDSDPVKYGFTLK
ncbi:MAG: proline racemase [Clostridium sp.]|nr:proline racemase [Clostridium sp.]